MKIGEVANQTGLSVDTIRFYEQRGIIDPADRTPSGYRTFEPAVIERLHAVRRMQQVGLSLDEIADALRAHDAGTATCENQRWRLDAVADRIDEKINELTALRATITTLRNSCSNGACQFVHTRSV